MGRPPSEKPRQWVRLGPDTWEIINRLARKNHRTKDLQIEAMLDDWLYWMTKSQKVRDTSRGVKSEEKFYRDLRE